MPLSKTNKNGDYLPSFMSDLFDSERFLTPSWLSSAFDKAVPSVNIKENGNRFLIELAAPGFNKGDFRIDIEDNVLTIGAEKEEEKQEEHERYTRKEYSLNSFSRSFTLPGSVDADKVDATYNDGILNLTIPKKETVRTHPRKEIKVG